MIPKNLIRLSLLLVSVSCTPYNSRFHCEAQKGIGCKSVTQIEDSIVEREEGPDLFLLTEKESGCKGCKKKKPVVTKATNSKRLGDIRVERIWFSGEKTPGGNQVEGHYVYFPIIEESEELSDLKSFYLEGE